MKKTISREVTYTLARMTDATLKTQIERKIREICYILTSPESRILDDLDKFCQYLGGMRERLIEKIKNPPPSSNARSILEHVCGLPEKDDQLIRQAVIYTAWTEAYLKKVGA